MDKYFKKYRKPLFTGVIIGMAVIALLLMITDARGVVMVLKGFRLQYLPLILLLAPLNYLLRYLKWNYFLKESGLYPDPAVNRYIFLSGLSMTITPGKIGELIKCYLLKEHIGAPVSATSSIVMAERVTDGIAMIILAAVGSLSYAYGSYVLLIAALALGFAVLIFQFDSLFDYFTSLLSRLKYLKSVSEFMKSFQRNAKVLFTPKSLLVATGLGVISWGFEGFVVYLAVLAFGGNISVLGSIFVVSISSILGAVSALPGGVVVAEGSIMAILIFTGLSPEMAAATTMVTRFSTLWLGVGIGIVGLYLTQKVLFEVEVAKN